MHFIRLQTGVLVVVGEFVLKIIYLNSGFLVVGGIFDIFIWKKVKVKDVRLYDGDMIDKPSVSEQEFEDRSSRPRTAYS